MKNAKGVIPNSEKRRYHTLGLHKTIAHLNTVLPPQLILVDNICGDLNFEEGGNPVVMNRIFACLDPVLCDAYVCECIGYSVDDVPYIRIAEKLGVGNADVSHTEFILLNEPSETPPNLRASGRIRNLEKPFRQNRHRKLYPKLPKASAGVSAESTGYRPFFN